MTAPPRSAVHAFYRAEIASPKHCYSLSTSLRPSWPLVGLTHGWLPGTTAATDDGSGRRVDVRFDARRWSSRLGKRRVDVLEEDEVYDETAQIVTSVGRDCVAVALPRRPDLSLLVVRWAPNDATEDTGFAGGWGPTASPVSNRYCDIFLGALHNALGCTYEVVTAWVGGTEDLRRLLSSAEAISATMRGRHKAAFWFLWPLDLHDGLSDDYAPGTVHQSTMLDAMLALQAVNGRTRQPFFLEFPPIWGENAHNCFGKRFSSS